MSIASTDLKSGPYTTNGTTTAFPVTFPFDANAHLFVYKTTTATGALELLVLDDDYSVTGALSPSGGTVTISPALAAGFTLNILRNVPLKQDDVEIANQSTYFPSVLEGGMDRRVQQIQMLAERINRAYLVPPGQASPDIDALLLSLVPFSTEYVAKTLLGEAQTAVTFGRFVPANDGWLEAIVLEAWAGPPLGQDLICKVKVGGVEQATNFTLASGSYYTRATPATATTIPVTAGQLVDVYLSQVGTTYKGRNITATLQFRKAFDP